MTEKDKEKHSEEYIKKMKALYLEAAGTGLCLQPLKGSNSTPASKKPATITPPESSAENGPGEDTEPTELERISIRLLPEDIERLREYFASRDLTLSQGIRTTIKDFMEKQGI